jgi:protein-S-isoprenylcysteine O-methyltransferase Ste14
LEAFDRSGQLMEVAGSFRISRRSVYLGMVAILPGIACSLGPLITFVFPVLFVVIVEFMFIPFEEADLE